MPISAYVKQRATRRRRVGDRRRSARGGQVAQVAYELVRHSLRAQLDPELERDLRVRVAESLHTRALAMIELRNKYCA